MDQSVEEVLSMRHYDKKIDAHCVKDSRQMMKEMIMSKFFHKINK